jgi:hypothetical protein
MKAERRRSLPARTSVVSLISTLTIASPEPEVSDFQLRRRRAAKLTHFFGVDYRVLIKEVLESIEKGVDDEQKKGTLNPAQAEVKSPPYSMSCVTTLITFTCPGSHAKAPKSQDETRFDFLMTATYPSRLSCLVFVQRHVHVCHHYIAHSSYRTL